MTNALYYGDNLGYLREMDRECVDLVYLAPPFNSNANYNLLFKSKGNAVQAQTTAFQDTWSWLEPAERAFNDVLASGSPVTGFLSALRSSMGDTNIMAYLAMMTVRLIEIAPSAEAHRVIVSSLRSDSQPLPKDHSGRHLWI